VIHLLAGVADAVATAHEAGVLHRDIKPGNILVSVSGYAKLADFGLAKLKDDSHPTATEDPTGKGIVIGTIAYMSPEQANGQTLDERSDMFSFGAVLYEMLAGRQPFRAATDLQLLQQVINAKPPPLSDDIPEPLRVLVKRALEKTPADRYSSMRELVAAMRNVHRASVRAALTPPTKRWSAIRKFALPAIGAFIALVAAAGVWRIAQGRDSLIRYPLQVTRVSKLTSFPCDEREPAISPDGSYVAFSWSGREGENYDIYVVQVGGQSPLRLTSDPAPDSFPAWSPDGRQIAFIRRNGGVADIIVAPPLGGPERTLHQFSRIGGDLDFSQHPVLNWSADSKAIIFSAQPAAGEKYQLFALSVDDGGVRAITSPDTDVGGDSSPALSQDGKSLAFVRYLAPLNGSIMIQPLSSGLIPRGKLTEVPKSGLGVHSPAWLEDRRQLLFADRSRIFQWERNKGTLQIYATDEVLGGMSVGPKGRDGSRQVVIASEKRDADIWFIPLDAKGTRYTGGPQIFIRSTENDSHPDFSPDGRHIAFTSSRGGTSEIWVSDADGGNPRQLTHLGAHVAAYPKWSPDGSQIAFHARVPDVAEIYVVDANQGVPRQITHENPGLALPTWSNDGQSIYASTLVGGRAVTYRIRVKGGSAERLWEGGLVRESADGKYVLYWKTTIPGIFRRPLDGDRPDNEELLVPDFWPANQLGGYAPVEGGIYYVSGDAQGRPEPFRYFDYASRKSFDVAPVVPGLGRGFAVSPDHRRFLFSASAEVGGDLLLLELR
jgi:eukaryotic-like serine/threonine-protein kinase